MAGKYAPLQSYLRGLPKNEKEVSFSFDQIEEILKSKLPASAYEDQRWWLHEKEANHVSDRAWANAGWKIKNVDVKKKKVKLIRVE